MVPRVSMSRDAILWYDRRDLECVVGEEGKFDSS